MAYINYLLAGFLSCGGQQAADGAAQESNRGNQWWIIVIYIVIFGAFIYFLMIRPQRKQRKQAEERMSSLEPGDSVLTSSGFYGTVVAINGDTVIVEFGNNKNCRIPMSRQAIAQIEKAGGSAAAQVTEGKGEKKFSGRKKDNEEAQPVSEESAEEIKKEADEASAQIKEAEAEADKAAEDVSGAADEAAKEADESADGAE